MEEIRDALKEHREEVTNPGAVSGLFGYDSIDYRSSDTITLSGGVGQPYSNTTISGGGYTVGNLPANASPYYTTGTGISGLNWGAGTTSITANPWATSTSTGRMELNGDNADLVINGVSILDILRDRLNVMIPNPELEKEWDQLKELGDQYRALEAKLKEQGEMWAKLKAMPPPDPLY